MKNADKGFIKLQRDLLSQPGVTDLLAKEGAAGLGLYVSLNLYLAHCQGGWGAYTNHQLSAIAIQMKKHRADVTRVIENYGLFVIEDGRFTSPWLRRSFKAECTSKPKKSASATSSPSSPKGADEVSPKLPQGSSEASPKLPQSSSKVSAKFLHPRAYILSRAEDIDKDIDINKDKENKEKSAFERVAGGVRHASHGQPLPADAPPQRHLNELYSYSRREWVAAEEFDAAVELPLCREMFNGKELEG